MKCMMAWHLLSGTSGASWAQPEIPQRAFCRSHGHDLNTFAVAHAAYPNMNEAAPSLDGAASFLAGIS